MLNRLKSFIRFSGLWVFLVALTTLPAMLLWNWLMPKLFLLTQITFLEMLGLLTLSNFFFNHSNRAT